MTKTNQQERAESMDKPGKYLWKKGSFTLEAACIMPLLLMIIALLLYGSFFLYNRCILPQKNYTAALRGSNYEKTQEGTLIDTETYMEEQKKELVGTKLLSCHREYLTVQTQNGKTGMEGKINIEEKIRMELPFGKLLQNSGFHYDFTIKDKKEIAVIKEVDFIRMCRKAERIIKRS